jgi:riboflavin synthase
MFTGLVEETGEIRGRDLRPDGARIRILASATLEGARVGDSISVSGVCLTVTAMGAGEFSADLAAETLRRTTLGDLRPGDRVNLERPLRMDQRLGGHVVQGHVDGVGVVAEIAREGDGIWMDIEAPQALRRYIAEKGSIAVDGVSLTVARLADPRFSVALIPHTLAITTLGRRRTGDRVNLEVDILAKYVERLMEGARAQ